MTATSVTQAKKLIRDGPFDLVLSDIRMPETDGFSFLSWVTKYDSSISVIMMTSFSDVETAVESMKMGAVDYIPKPIEPEAFFKKINNAFKSQENKLQNEQRSKMFVKPPFAKYKVLFDQLDQFALQNAPVLITGDRGTGKSSAAKYIYEKSEGKTKPFVQMDEDFLRDTTVSVSNGKTELQRWEEELEKARGGALYICDVENLSQNLQHELLSLLQSQKSDDTYTRVIVSSTKKCEDLRKCLVPKLSTILESNHMHLSPLKDQKNDILFFADYFLSFANSEFGKDIKKISPQFVEKLVEYPWPGNIQELKNFIIKAVLLAEGSEITMSAAPEFMQVSQTETKTDHIAHVKVESLKKENYEKAKIKEALDLARGNKTLAASILNIDRKTLYNKIKTYGVELPG